MVVHSDSHPRDADATNAVTKVTDLGMAAQPLGATFDRTGRKVYVTQWLGRAVSVIDTATETTPRPPPSNPLKDDPPSAIAANPRRDEVYTANAHSDTVPVIETRSDRFVATIDVALTPDAREGASPTA